jgi:alginate O-acetyltransferase complex protein AlgI
MLFPSVPFLFYFLPVFLTLYLLLPQRGHARNIAALVGSLVFYAWGELTNLWVLALSIALTYGVGLRVAGRKIWLAVGVSGHFLLLGWFKYAGFMLASLADLGIDLPLTAMDAPTLPLGISFFTFHALSYLIDVYRGKAPPARKLQDLALYILLFPQLIAGPIVRFSTLHRQIGRRWITLGRVRIGMELLCLGLMQKLLIADTLARAVDPIFALPTADLTPSVAWMGAVLYTLQLYMDFSGYSHMALGLALMLGFRFPRNFNFPLRATSVTDFWRRWHISLSRWFRDYLYIPLGGSRNGAGRTALNLMLVFLLCGLWHGATWNALAWGAYNGFFLGVERVGLGRVLERLPLVGQRAYALLVFITGLVIFRSADLGQAGAIWAAMAGFGGTDALTSVIRFAAPSIAVAAVIAMTSLLPLKQMLPAASFATPRWPGLRALACLLALLTAAMLLAHGSYSPFLYFRF